MNMQNRFRERFRFREDIREKRVCPRSQRLRRHRVNVVNDYVDIVSA